MYTIVTKHVAEYSIMEERNLLSQTRGTLNIYNAFCQDSVKLNFFFCTVQTALVEIIDRLKHVNQLFFKGSCRIFE